MLIVLAVPAAAGCGSQSPADQVRATEVRAVAALTSAHPEEACQYVTNHDACIGLVAEAKAVRLQAAAILGIPDDWRARVARAKVTVADDHATLAPGPTGQVAHFVRRNGHWLAASSS